MTRDDARNVGTLVVWAMVTLGQGAFAEDLTVLSPSPDDAAEFHRYVEEGWDSPFGLDYVFVLDRTFRAPELARQLGGQMGVRWVNFARVNWGEIEPKAPVAGRHAYNWAPLDEGVRQWQQYGVHILMSLRFACPWANAKPSGEEFTYLSGPWSAIPKASADYRPTPEHEQDLRDFITALVDRYDGDGANDMPGLRFPVLHYQVCNEAYNELFWAGTVSEYGALLSQVAQAARKACPRVKLMLSGICFNEMLGFYDKEMDARTKAYVDRNLPKVPPRMLPFLCRMDEFSRTSLRFPDYDLLDARWSNFGVVARCQEELRKAGRGDVEVWSAEIYTPLPLLDAMVLPMTTLYPFPAPSRSLDYIRITRNPKDPQFDEVNCWYRGMQAAMVVRLTMVGLDAGTKKMMTGWALDSQTPIAPYPLAVVGYKSLTFDRLWPAAYTYRLLIEKLDGVTACHRVPMPDFEYVYECSVRNGKKVIVAFYDDHAGRNQDEPIGGAMAEFPFVGQGAVVTHVITELDEVRPRVERLRPEEGKLRLRLTEHAVFIEAE